MSCPRASAASIPAAVPDAPHRFALVRDVAEFPQRGQTSGFGILTAIDPFLDADSEMAADFFVEVVVIRAHRLLPACRRIHDAADRVHELRPAILLARQLSLASGGELVILRALIGLADTPLGLQPSVFFEAVERGVERAGFDPQQVLGLRADRLADAMAVLGPPLEGPENRACPGCLGAVRGGGRLESWP